LVYTTDSKSVASRRGGSSPPTGTTYIVLKINDLTVVGLFFCSRKNTENP
jgi:hypothetical protein